MRPTNLNFRHPRESTPDPYDVILTTNGIPLFESKKHIKATFSTSERFKQIKSDKTSFWRGPGSYDMSYMNIGKNKPGKVHIYRPHYLPGGAQGNFNYYGNSLVNQDKFFLIKQSQQSFEKVIQKSRSTSASTRFRSVMRTVNSPNLNMDGNKSSRSGIANT